MPRLWQAPLVAVSVGNAVLFWVFVQALFDDAFVLRPLHGLVWLAPFTMGVQRALPLVFSVLAALAAARHWRSDLVEERRRLRVFIVVTGIVYTLASLAARLASPRGQLSGLTATLDVAGLLAIVLAVAMRMLRVTRSTLFAPSAPVANDATQPPVDPAEDRLAQALEHAMTVERAYRAEDMSLGYRNFNAYINGFRPHADRVSQRE